MADLLYDTAYASAADAHTTNNTWEDVNSMSATIDTTGLGVTKILCLCSLQPGIVDTHWEHMQFRFDLDSSVQSEVYLKSKNTIVFEAEQYILTFHAVFEAVAEGSHTVKVQWHDNGSDANCTIYSRRLTIIAFASGLATAQASAADAHTTNNTWEDVNSMSVNLTPASQSDVLVLFTCMAQGVSANWEYFGFRINRDANTELSESIYKERNSEPASSEVYIFHMATIFENVSAAAHTFKAQWHDHNSGLDCTITARRITAIAFPCETAYASANDDHSANNTYETIDSMSVTLTTPVAILVMLTDIIGGTSAHNERWRERFLLDGATAGEDYTKFRTSNPDSSEIYPENIHTVFEALSFANHTAVGRWHDNAISLDVTITKRRIIGIILTEGAVSGWTGKVSGVTNPGKIYGVDVANIVSVMGVS